MSDYNNINDETKDQDWFEEYFLNLFIIYKYYKNYCIDIYNIGILNSYS